MQIVLTLPSVILAPPEFVLLYSISLLDIVKKTSASVVKIYIFLRKKIFWVRNFRPNNS
jgi:hypothetical protein